jgi:transposase-like protein
MRAKQFNELLDSVRSLTQTQRRKLIDAAQKASAIDDTVAVINERVTPEHPCPHCNSQHSHRWGYEEAILRYRCQDCRRTFNSLTGTSLARLKQRIALESLNIKAGTRVRQRVFHVQNVNAYDSRLKGWMDGLRGVATRHLPHYLGWRRLLDKEGATLTASGFLRPAMG